MGLTSQMLGSRRTSPSVNSRLFSISIESLSESDNYTRRQDLVSVNKFNEDVKSWSKKTVTKLKRSIKTMINRDYHLSASLKGNIYYDYQHAKEANKVGFSFAREGIYVHKGAGEGQGGTIGSTWFDMKGQHQQTQPSSLFKMGTKNRKPKEWFDMTVKNELPQLADITSEYSASLIIETTTLFIN